ncbi:MAG TPA: serine protease [Bacteroidota bacterium]|nr:serine protease [Bacteroidota bacterium]
MQTFMRVTAVLILGACLSSCGPSLYNQMYPTLIDGKYDSEFPYRACSEQLEEISESVLMVNAVAYYRSYTFGAEEHIRPGDITADFLHGRTRSVMTTNQAAGTATVIGYENRRVVLMTCAHVVDFPDTEATYYFNEDHRPTGFLHTIAFKEKQTNYVSVLPEGGELQILALDRNLDIALMGKTFDVEPFPPLKTFMYPAGHARELEWGTFVYLFGYPSGHKMVTKAIVSSPNRDKRGTFLVDAVFSRGFSGGIALAIRDGVPNFELVGIVKLVSGHSEYYLAPETTDSMVDYDPTVPYKGELFVDRRTEIEYGIVQAVPMEAILEFIDSSQAQLQAYGYVVHFPPPKSTTP